nr:MAG TPA: hypothetical protein [Caudoviricetes sp.]
MSGRPRARGPYERRAVLRSRLPAPRTEEPSPPGKRAPPPLERALIACPRTTSCPRPPCLVRRASRVSPGTRGQPPQPGTERRPSTRRSLLRLTASPSTCHRARANAAVRADI